MERSAVMCITRQQAEEAIRHLGLDPEECQEITLDSGGVTVNRYSFGDVSDRVLSYTERFDYGDDNGPRYLAVKSSSG